MKRGNDRDGHGHASARGDADTVALDLDAHPIRPTLKLTYLTLWATY